MSFIKYHSSSINSNASFVNSDRSFINVYVCFINSKMSFIYVGCSFMNSDRRFTNFGASFINVGICFIQMKKSCLFYFLQLFYYFLRFDLLFSIGKFDSTDLFVLRRSCSKDGFHIFFDIKSDVYQSCVFGIENTVS